MLNLSALSPIPMSLAEQLLASCWVFLLGSSYRTKPGRVAIDSFLLKVPIFGDLLTKYEMANMSETHQHSYPVVFLLLMAWKDA